MKIKASVFPKNEAPLTQSSRDELVADSSLLEKWNFLSRIKNKV